MDNTVHEIQKPQLSPVFLTSTIMTPLRYYFSYYAGEDLKWSTDPSSSKIDISASYNIHKKSTEFKPRIIVSRGGYQISPTGLTDNLAEGRDMETTKGLSKSVHLLLTSGVSGLRIQASNEGVCQRIADHVHHFVSWTSHILCNTQGFKKFGFPLQVSDVMQGREDKELFEIVVQIPWMKEEMWRVENDSNKISNIIMQFTNLETQVST